MSPQQKIVDVLRREIPYLQEKYGVKKMRCSPQADYYRELRLNI